MKEITAVGEIKLKYETKQKAADRPKIRESKDAETENEAIIYYQSANYVYKNKLNRWN